MCPARLPETEAPSNQAGPSRTSHVLKVSTRLKICARAPSRQNLLILAQNRGCDTSAAFPRNAPLRQGLPKQGHGAGEEEDEAEGGLGKIRVATQAEGGLGKIRVANRSAPLQLGTHQKTAPGMTFSLMPTCSIRSNRGFSRRQYSSPSESKRVMFTPWHRDPNP